MRSKVIWIVSWIVGLAIIVWSYTDWQCVRDCRAKGYSYDVCVHQCSSR